VTDRDDASPTVASLGPEAADPWDPTRPDGPVGPWEPTPPGSPTGLWGPTAGDPAEPWDPARPDASAGSSDLTRAGRLGPHGGAGHRQHRWTGIAGYAAVAAAAAIGGALVGGRRPTVRRWYPSPGGQPSAGG